jgi:hypothetical protein
MERYIDADKIDYTRVSIYCGRDNRGKEVYRNCFVAFESDIDEMPTADVAPKSEIDKLHEVIFMKEDLMQSIAKERNHYYDELQKTKQEVAREIFEEIANMMVLQHGFNERHIVAHIDFELLKELRKKYTEGETDEKQQTCQG